MAAPVHPPHIYTPLSLTAAQARTLRQYMLSTDPISNAASRPAPAAARPNPKPTQTSPHPQQVQQTVIIDVSTRIMGHCNTVHVANTSPQEQVTKLEHMMRSIVAGADKGQANLNITVQAGLDVVGSRNCVAFGSPPAKETAKVSAHGEVRPGVKINGKSAGRKRRAESEPVDAQRVGAKKVKVEDV